ncbi:sulfotransferase [Sulfitobacter sp.]|uniref:sulfotransferase n=1 Tax=Sulfitobacter sp. TaxID=1903071 RepID=UPI00356310B9
MSDGKGLTYILGLPYSGSSLFAMALGNAEGFVNCGEINYLEQDYHEHRRCSCNALLADCPFWGPLIAQAHERAAAKDPMPQFETEAKYHPIYARRTSLSRRLSMIMGRDLRKTYGAQSIDEHLAQQLGFMRLVLAETGAQEIVDASKNARRLQLLAEQDEFQLRVIVLSRHPENALGARIKRARRRTNWYRQALAPIYTLWLLFHYIQMGKALAKVPKDRVFRVKYEDFVRDPASMEKVLRDWYGRPISFDRIGDREVNMRNTHVYTGNTWLTRGTKEPRSTVLNAPMDAPELNWFELAQFRFFATLFPILRRRP